MTNIFDRFFKGTQHRTAQTAKERLRFVLVTDRSQLSPEELRQMQAEILGVIRKYCRIDEEAVDMKVEARDRSNYLVADIPLRKTNPNTDEEPGRISFMMETTASIAADDNHNGNGNGASDTRNDVDAKTTAQPAVESVVSENQNDATAQGEDVPDTDKAVDA